MSSTTDLQLCSVDLTVVTHNYVAVVIYNRRAHECSENAYVKGKHQQVPVPIFFLFVGLLFP